MNLILLPIFAVIPFLNNFTGLLIKSLFKHNIFNILIIISLLLVILSLIIFFVAKINNHSNQSLIEIDWKLTGTVSIVAILFIIPNLIILFLFKYFKPPFVILVLSILGIIIAYIFNLYTYQIKTTVKDILLILLIIGCLLIISRNPAFYQDTQIKNQFMKKFCVFEKNIFLNLY